MSTGANVQRNVIDGHFHVSAQLVDHAIKIMDLHGIEIGLDMTWSFGDELFDKLQAYAKYPGRLYGCCGINYSGLGDPGWLKREKEALLRHLDAGAIGIKVWKDLGLHQYDVDGKLIRVDDERLGELFEFAQDQGALIAFHIADPKGFFMLKPPNQETADTLFNYPEWSFSDRERFIYDWWQLIRQLERVVARHNRGTIVGCHVGCAAEEIGYVAEMLRDHPHYMIDMSARIGELGRHDTPTVQRFFTEFQDRIIFGSDIVFKEDWPGEKDAERLYSRHWQYFETSNQGLDHPFAGAHSEPVEGINLPKDILQKVYYDNAKRIYLK